MSVQIGGFAFNDFCQHCQRVMEHKIELQDQALFGVCSICGEKRKITGANEVYYPKTELWVTRFKIGNIQNVVTGKLLDTIKHVKKY
jgi:hypothetical protein